MRNQFTTPEFADVLKRHGIEIDTQFYWENNGNGLRLMAIACDSPYTICIGEFDPTSHPEFAGKPAYLISQVLGWLPQTVTDLDGRFELVMKPNGLAAYESTGGDGCKYKYSFFNINIEQLVTQGLTEGWLSKEIIEQQIKQNQ